MSGYSKRLNDVDNSKLKPCSSESTLMDVPNSNKNSSQSKESKLISRVKVFPSFSDMLLWKKPIGNSNLMHSLLIFIDVKSENMNGLGSTDNLNVIDLLWEMK